MRKITLTMAALMVASAAFASPARSEPNKHAQSDSCGSLSQAELKACLAKKADHSQAKLDQAEKLVADKLSRWDEDAQYVDRARASLVAAEKSFVQFRKAQCDFMASLSGGAAGNASESLRLACIAELNGQRAASLRKAVSDLPEQ
jgi:uncharacterized protein YecT (DUF1311 family)